MPSPLDEVLEAFQALLDARRDTPVPTEAGRGNFRCERCDDCSHCRFCIDCTVCEDCTYCEGCDGCTGCTHCKHCSRCKQTTHSLWSSECSESSYLTLCLDCKSCVQCFACVGLQNEEFCVLNEKLPRKAYFSRVAALKGALEERMSAGWRPPWVPELEEPEGADEVDEVDEIAQADEDQERTPVPPLRPDLAAMREAARDDDAARAAKASRDDLAWNDAGRRENAAPRAEAARREEHGPQWGEAARRDDGAAQRSDAWRDEVATLRGEAWREEVAALRGEARRVEEAAAPRGEARRVEAAAPRGEARRDEAAAPRGDSRRDDPPPLRSEPPRRDSGMLRPEPLPARVEADSRPSARPEQQWMPPPAPPLRAADDDERAGRSDITVDVSDDEEPPPRSRGTTPWSFADVRRGRAAPTEPEDELIPEPPPFNSGPHPAAEPAPAREDGSVVAHAVEEPTRRRERAQPVEPARDRYGWSAQSEGTPVRMGWSVQAEGEPERLSWTSADDERDRLRWPEPRPSRWSGSEGSGGWSPRADANERRPPPPKASPAEDPRPWPPKATTTRPPKAPAPAAPELRPLRPPERPPEEGVRQARPPKTGWDDPPELHRDPHENDFDRRRRETAASPSASEIDLDNRPPAYGRDRPFDPEPPLQLDVWSAYEQLQRSRLGPEEHTEPDAPVARRGPGRADLSGAAVASEEDSARRPEAPRVTPHPEAPRVTPRPETPRVTPRPETTGADASTEGKAAPRSLGVARRPERPAPPEPRDRGGAMLRGRAPARPAPPAPARQPDAPSLRRARRPARVRDESTSEYLAVDGPSNDPEQS